MSTTKIDALDFAHAANGTTSTAQVVPKIAVLDNGNVYIGNVGNWLGSGGNLYDNTSTEISTVTASQTLYIVDGTAHTSGTMIQVSMITGASARIPTGSANQPPDRARLIALYRNRLVLSRTVDDDYNYFMSAVNAYTTFDYADQTVTGAVAGNNCAAGKIGDVITAFIPVTDDYGIFGCEDSVWLLRGDPKNGGRIDNLIWGGGIVDQWAWARDVEGRCYYHSRMDIMVIPAGGGVPQSITQGRLINFFKGIDFATTTVRMCWDTFSKGLWIFYTKATATGNINLYWDARLDAFSEHVFPNNHGPTALRSLSGEVYQQRQILMGGFDGILRTFQPGWTTDDGTVISSRLRMTPVAIAEAGERGIVTETEITLGIVESPNVTVKLFMGDNAQQSMTRTDSAYSVTLTGTGRQQIRERGRGQVATYELSNAVLGKQWALETAIGQAQYAGRNR